MRLFLGFLALTFLAPLGAFAQTAGTEAQLLQVVSVQSAGEQFVPGTSVGEQYQTLTADVVEGADKGETVTIENDYAPLSVGEKFYAEHVVDAATNTDTWNVSDPYRLPELGVLAVLFMIVVVIFGGMQGIRALLSLALSLFFIAFLLLPGILHGYSPVAVAVGVASLIIVLGSYITHGFNKVTTSAVAGMVIAVLLTGVLASVSIHSLHLTGMASEETVALNFDTSGSIDFAGLLLGGVLIGLLGVLYDAAIGQAVAIDELMRAAPEAPRGHIFWRALRIGREHIGALVNTLAIAYVGVSLPLLLLFYLSPDASIASTINKEIFTTEIARALIGGIGLVLAVPLTTVVATYVLARR